MHDLYEGGPMREDGWSYISRHRECSQMAKGQNKAWCWNNQSESQSLLHVKLRGFPRAHGNRQMRFVQACVLMEDSQF